MHVNEVSMRCWISFKKQLRKKSRKNIIGIYERCKINVKNSRTIFTEYP